MHQAPCGPYRMVSFLLVSQTLTQIVKEHISGIEIGSAFLFFKIGSSNHCVGLSFYNLNVTAIGLPAPGRGPPRVFESEWWTVLISGLVVGFVRFFFGATFVAFTRSARFSIVRGFTFVSKYFSTSAATLRCYVLFRMARNFL